MFVDVCSKLCMTSLTAGISSRSRNVYHLLIPSLLKPYLCPLKYVPLICTTYALSSLFFLRKRLQAKKIAYMRDEIMHKEAISK
jgi:hypothetical protein